MVWYIPPLSPVTEAVAETGFDGEDAGNLFVAGAPALRPFLEHAAALGQDARCASTMSRPSTSTIGTACI